MRALSAIFILAFLFTQRTFAQAGPTVLPKPTTTIAKVGELLPPGTPPRAKAKFFYQLVPALRDSLKDSTGQKVKGNALGGISGIGNGGDYLVCQNGGAKGYNEFLDLQLFEGEREAGLVHLETLSAPQNLDDLKSQWRLRAKNIAAISSDVAPLWNEYVEDYFSFLENQSAVSDHYEIYLVEQEDFSELEPAIAEGLYNIKVPQGCRYETHNLHIHIGDKTIILVDAVQLKQDLSHLQNLSWAMTHEFLWDLARFTNYSLATTRALNYVLHSREFNNQSKDAVSFFKFAVTKSVDDLNFASSNYYYDFASLELLDVSHVSMVSAAVSFWIKQFTRNDVLATIVLKQIYQRLLRLAISTQDPKVLEPFISAMDLARKPHSPALLIAQTLNVELEPQMRAVFSNSPGFIGAFNRMDTYFRQDKASQNWNTPGLLIQIELSYARRTLGL